MRLIDVTLDNVSVVAQKPMRTLFDPTFRRTILSRLRRLRPETTTRWGRMTAPQVIAHLSDQVRHTLGDALCAPRPSVLR